MTFVDRGNYVLFGGIEDSNSAKIAPSGDIYSMKLHLSK